MSMAGDVEASTLARAGFADIRNALGAANRNIFTVVNPFAVAQAKNQGAKLVTLVSDESRQAIRTIVGAAIETGISPRDTARLIRTVVGLNERQALAVMHFRAKLHASGASSDLLEKSANRYAQQLLRQRALTIAQTELNDALVKGQQLLWQSAQAQGKLPRTLEQRWIVTPDDRLCEYCQAMDGQRSPVGVAFQTPLGPRTGPPMHPKCRCALGLTETSRSKVRPPAPSLQRGREAVKAAESARKAQALKKAKQVAAAQKAVATKEAKKRSAQQALINDKATAASKALVKLKGEALAHAVAAQVTTIASQAKVTTPAALRYIERQVWASTAKAKAAAAAKASEAAKKAAVTKAAKAKSKLIAPKPVVAMNSADSIRRAILEGQPVTGWPITDDVVRRLGSKYPQEVAAHARAWMDSLPELEREAIRYYSGAGYRDVNAELRANPTLARHSRYVEAIKSAIRKAPAPPPPDLVWRGMRSLGPFKDLEVGREVKLPGFQSTSIDPDFAKGWGTYLLEVKPKAGGYIKPLSHHPHEWEYLLPHNATYRVVGRRKVWLNNEERTVVQVEMLDAGS
jgi:hypothetical protein